MTRRHTTTHTIQVWPGGQSYEYRGDPDGPENQRSLRAGYYQARVRCPKSCDWYYRQGHRREEDTPLPICTTCANTGYIANPIKNPWRKGTPAEWRAIRIELRAELYWSRDGHGCDSALVDDLIKAANFVSDAEYSDLREGFGYDEIRNLYADPSDWDAAQCREYIADHGLDLPSAPTLTCTTCEGTGSDEGRACTACVGGEMPDPAADDDDSPRGYLTELRDVCRDHAQDNPAEVYEWWRVSSWLCEELHAIGEVTIDNGYGHWWGRTCTGQMLLMDGTLQKVAARHEREGA